MKNKHYLVYGLGLANQAVVEYFTNHGYSYKVYIDSMEEYHNEILEDVDIIIKSPGIRFDTDLLIEAKSRKIEIIGDLELFFRLRPNLMIICVTGTNGKTTTCKLLEEILKTKYQVMAIGNIGIPLFNYVENQDLDLVIIEASSYMLRDTLLFHPHVSIILNLFPNHLDHHHNRSDYYQSKKKAIINLTKNDYFIYQSSNRVLSYWVEKTKANCISYDSLITDEEKQILDNVNISGSHNVMNIRACLKSAKLFDIDIEDIKEVVTKFILPKYRMEKRILNERVIVYNDAKATNALASKAALLGVDKKDDFKLLWIGGGMDRKDDLSYLSSTLSLIDKAYLFGETKYSLAKLLSTNNIPFELFNDLEEIIKQIKSEDWFKIIILFSPGAPSYDQYQSYLIRGAHFDKLIDEIFL